MKNSAATRELSGKIYARPDRTSRDVIGEGAEGVAGVVRFASWFRGASVTVPCYLGLLAASPFPPQDYKNQSKVSDKWEENVSRREGIFFSVVWVIVLERHLADKESNESVRLAIRDSDCHCTSINWPIT